MNQFVVSARKYRPATFDTVVGQAHITNTLKNAIHSKHLAQAFLFCGPRGVGKTTCARILAKTINCKNITAQIEACNECDSCKSFNNGQSLNIYELDAASNNSVDDIRSLVDQVRYAPHSGEYKIYIIDEVHMLSASAFNAFLKTLEEPPPYAIFILATTEKHKIIPTILSRCQIFDFNRIQIDDIASHLNYVATQEGVNADPDALHIIAQKADGALRDALSIFDQIVSFAGNTITYKDVINNLSILDYDYYFKITDDIGKGDIARVLLTFNELLSDGFDGHHFINGLAGHFRDLLVCQDVDTVTLLEVSKNIRERYLQQAKQTAPALLLKLLEICSKCDIDYRIARNQRLHVELALIKMCALSGSELLSHPASNPIPEKKSSDPAPLKTPVDAPSVSATTPPPAAPVYAAPIPVSPPVSTSGNMVNDPLPGTITPNRKVLEDLPPTPPITTTPAVPKIPSLAGSGLKPGGGSMLKGASISTALQPKPEEQAAKEQNLDDLPADAFDQFKLQSVWDNYAELMQREKKPQLFNTMKMSELKIVSPQLIELVIHNQSQDNILTEEKPGLMTFLRKELNNFHLQLATRIVEKRDTDDLAYTNKENYQKMVQTNPELDDMRKQLGLELDS
ncbi:DNA polymerase III subunit gamma/tau [soil metagenome]